MRRRRLQATGRAIGLLPPRAAAGRWLPREGLAAAVAVFEAYDIVLAEIAARLDLDQVHRDLAGVFEPMQGSKRNIGRLVFGQHHLLVAATDLGGALDDDPMLGAVMVHLQRQLAAGL